MTAVHGSPSTYRNRGCRCDECRAAQTDAVRDYRERRRTPGYTVRPYGRCIQKLRPAGPSLKRPSDAWPSSA